MLEGTTNPSAPKVPRRDNLAASDTNGQICQDWYNFSWGGPCSPGRAAKKCTWLRSFEHFADRPKIVQMDRFDPTWPQHCPGLGSTSASKAPTTAQLGAIGPTSAQLGSKMAQLHSNLDPFGSNFCPPQLGVKLSELTWTSMCITWLQYGIWIGLGPTSPQHDQLAQVGPRWGRPGTKLGPIQLDATRWKFAFLPLLPTFLGFDLWWGFVQSHVAHIGLVLGPTSAPDALYTGPSCARKAKLASKRAQVAPCSAPAGLARFSPLCPIPWVRAVLVKKRLKVSSFRSTANVLHSQVYTRIAWCEHCQCEPTWQSAN